MGVDARGFPGGLLRLDPAFACGASFLMTFATGRAPHAGSWQEVTKNRLGFVRDMAVSPWMTVR